MILGQLKINEEKVYFTLLLLIAVLIPTAEASPVKMASMSVIVLTAWWLASGNFKEKFYRLKNNKLAWLLIGLFLINLISITRTANLDDGFSLITRKLSLLLLPLIMATSPRLTRRQVIYITFAFIASLFVASILTFREGIGIVLNRVDLTDLVRLVYIHRPYFGLFSAFAVVSLLYSMKYNKSVVMRALLVAAIAYFLFFIYVLYAKMTVLALTALFVVLTGIALVKKLNVYVNLAILVCLLFSMYQLWRTNESVRVFYDKISNFEDFSYQEYNIHLVSSINIRYINWGCSVQVLKQEQNWLTGVGPGDVQEKLSACYEGLNPWIFELQQNAHNEYLEEMLRNGIIGLVLLLLSLGIPMGLSLQQNNLLYFSFLVLFAICCITENMLSRQTGVMFFAFFNSLFAFNTLKRKEDTALKFSQVG